MSKSKNTNIPRKEKEAILENLKKVEDIDLKKVSDEEFQQIYSHALNEAIKLARDDFYTFVLLCAPLIIPDGEFVNGRHIKVIADSLTEVERSVKTEKAKRQMIFLPPRCMKSVLVNRLFVPWCFGRHPHWKILVIGHGTQFAETNFGRPTRDFMNEPFYKQIFPEVTLKKDSRAAGRFETNQKGIYQATGAGSGIAGMGGDLVIGDDVLNEQTARSKIEREGINKWYAGGLRTRLSPGGAEVLVNTRWHEEDLCGFLLEADKNSARPWDVISIPALLDNEASKLLDLPEDTSCFPELWSTEYFEDLRNTEALTDYEWNALYMQTPTPEEGNIIKTDDIKFWDSEELPRLKLLLMSLDTAYSTKETADPSAMTLWGVFEHTNEDGRGRRLTSNHIILVSAMEERLSFPELCDKVLDKYRQYTPDIVLIEKKSSGQGLIPELKLMGVPVKEYMPEKDKMTRLHAASGYFTSGRVWFPRNRTWATNVINQLLSFPYAKHDDLTDTTSQAILWLRNNLQAYTQAAENVRDEMEEEDIVNPNKKIKTYWSVLNN